jgi:cathepsin A (carboxypeptidase C)
MRLTTSALVLGAASSATALQGQKVLSNPWQQHIIEDVAQDVPAPSDSWAERIESLFGDASAEAMAMWDEISEFVPDAAHKFEQMLQGPKPKPATRRPNSHWDHVVKGADVQNIQVQGADGSSRPKFGDHLENFNLRAKKVDPSKLGIDTVTQYSGYLDDEEQDKHLFYCEFINQIFLLQSLSH